ncbi:MAG: type VII secretion protein EssC [Lachnospira sp.]
MNARYKVTISNRNIYKEIELSKEDEFIIIGTSIDADVRLRKELFFDNIQLELRKINGIWSIFCLDNIYFNLGDTRKLMSLQLEHGISFKVCYQNSDNDLFSVDFMIDFDYERKNYDREIDLNGISSVKIGGDNSCSIIICDEYIGNDFFELKNLNGKWFAIDNGCRYGVNVNGKRIEKREEIGNHYFLSVVGYSFYYSNNRLFTSTCENIKVINMNERILVNHSTVFEYPKFIRNTRIQYELPNEYVEIQQPSSKPKNQKRSFMLSLIPTLVMFAMTIVLRGIIGGGGTFVIYSAVSMGMGIITSIITFFKDKKEVKKEIKEREISYKKYISEKEEKIQKLRDEELRISRKIYESIDEDLQEVEHFGKRLFEKSREDKDFLKVYLGKGEVESLNPIKYNKMEFVDLEDPITLLPEEIAEKYKIIKDAPIVLDFLESCGVGVVGSHNQLTNMMKNITLDLAIRHYYNEVKFVYILDSTYVHEFDWIRWLKNVYNKELDIKNIVCDEESKNIVLENLYANLSMREAILGDKRDFEGFEEQYVVFVTSAESISTHPISKYIKNCKELGFTFVFFEENEEKLPLGCTEIIRLIDSGKGELLKAQNGELIYSFDYNAVPNDIVEKAALKLGAIYVDEVSLEGQLTKNITMFEMLGIIVVDDLDLGARWGASQVYRTMAAPIGVKSGNEIVYLNISDKGNGHGPHGLVAGTTGSGKSEILQTYILSLATLFHPNDVGFVIIDFKGGGMANQFENLPHLIGTITNIDGREIDRSLLSIKAELVKRQEMLSDAGVNHINDYIKLFKAGKVEKPMPHLIMIVDEFAELKQEYPDFMKELISAARIGRTLGVHLILATQKPAGVVDAQIWSNSKFKLCLKVQTKEDSNEVLKSPLAAEIVEPGRAYFQVGNNEIFELVQSAYSGANIPDGNTNQEKVFTMYECNTWGKKIPVYSNKKKTQTADEISQLDAIVNYVNLYCKANNISRLPGICLPSVPTDIRTELLKYSVENDVGYTIPFGIYDDPEMQRQGEASIDVSRDNIYVVGSAQMGKTVFLQTIAYGLIRKYTPEQINIYMVDCGSMVLKIFEDSHHVGGVVLSSEEEKCKNLFKLLNTIVIERKKVLSENGVGNFSSYIEAGYRDMPQIVVMIDNYAAFKEYFPEQNDMINSLTREAQGVGLSFIVTAATSNAMNYRTQANFGKKMTLNCNDNGEYSNMFGHCKMFPRENTGRGLFVIEKRILEFQVAMFGKSNKEAERSKELKQFIALKNSENNKKATLIPMVPDKLILENIMSEQIEMFRSRAILPVGMEFNTVEYNYIDMINSGTIVLIGDNESRIQFMRNILLMLAKNIVFHNVEAIVIDDKQKSLVNEGKFGFVRTYTNDVSEGLAYLTDYYDMVVERENNQEIDTMFISLLVINNSEVFKQICADKNMSKELASIIKRVNGVNSYIILGQVENLPVGFNSSEVLKVLKDERNGILFAPITENKFFDISGRVKADSNFNRSMAYRFADGGYTKIKLFE